MEKEKIPGWKKMSLILGRATLKLFCKVFTWENWREFKEDSFVKRSSECKYHVRSEYKIYPEQVVAPGIISKAYMES